MALRSTMKKAVSLVFLAGWGVLGAAACGGDDDGGSGPGPSGGNGPALETLPNLLAKTVCEQQAACLGPLLDVYLRGQDCVKITQRTFEDGEFGTIASLVASGKLTYDAQKAQACLDGFAARTCTSPDNDAPDVCAEVYAGTGKTGDACTVGAECALDFFCEAGSVCPGSCAPKRKATEACAEDEQCSSGLSCLSGKCGAKVGKGGECGGGIECVGGLICVGKDDAAGKKGACDDVNAAFAAPVGAACDVANGPYCVPGAACQLDTVSATGASYVCVAPVASGAPCKLALPDACPDDEYCPVDLSTSPPVFEGVCTKRPAAGQPCGKGLTGDTCGAYEVCENGVCTDRQPIGGACTGSGTCYSGLCKAGVCAAGLSCEPPRLAAANYWKLQKKTRRAPRLEHGALVFGRRGEGDCWTRQSQVNVLDGFRPPCRSLHRAERGDRVAEGRVRRHGGVVFRADRGADDNRVGELAGDRRPEEHVVGLARVQGGHVGERREAGARGAVGDDEDAVAGDGRFLRVVTFVLLDVQEEQLVLGLGAEAEVDLAGDRGVRVEAVDGEVFGRGERRDIGEEGRLRRHDGTSQHERANCVLRDGLDEVRHLRVDRGVAVGRIRRDDADARGARVELGEDGDRGVAKLAARAVAAEEGRTVGPGALAGRLDAEVDRRKPGEEVSETDEGGVHVGGATSTGRARVAASTSVAASARVGATGTGVAARTRVGAALASGARVTSGACIGTTLARFASRARVTSGARIGAAFASGARVASGARIGAAFTGRTSGRTGRTSGRASRTGRRASRTGRGTRGTGVGRRARGARGSVVVLGGLRRTRDGGQGERQERDGDDGKGGTRGTLHGDNLQKGEGVTVRVRQNRRARR
jgi:hypothetical protein